MQPPVRGDDVMSDFFSGSESGSSSDSSESETDSELSDCNIIESAQLAASEGMLLETA